MDAKIQLHCEVVSFLAKMKAEIAVAHTMPLQRALSSQKDREALSGRRAQRSFLDRQALRHLSEWSASASTSVLTRDSGRADSVMPEFEGPVDLQLSQHETDSPGDLGMIRNI